MSDRLTDEQLDEMSSWDIRVANIFHIQGAIVCGGESLPTEFERFLEDDHELIAAHAEQWLPGLGKAWVDGACDAWEQENKEGNRRGADAMYLETLADLMRRCPKTFLVMVERADQECVVANPDRPCLGTWRGGFGIYRCDFHFVDSVGEAVDLSIALSREAREESWKAAVKAGRVQASRPIAENFSEI